MHNHYSNKKAGYLILLLVVLSPVVAMGQIQEGFLADQAEICALTERWDSALVYQEEAMRSHLERGDSSNWVKALPAWAHYMEREGKAEENIEPLTEALAWVERQETIDLGLTARLNHAIGHHHYFGVEDLDSAAYFLEKVLEIREQIPDLGDDELADWWRDLAQVYDYQSRYQISIAALEKEWEIRARSKGGRSQEAALPMERIGNAMFSLGQFREAIAMQEKVLDIRKECLGMEHTEVARSFIYIGQVKFMMGDLAGALEQFQEALEVQIRITGKADQYVAASYCNIGVVYKQMGEYRSSQKNLKEALAISIDVLEEDDLQIATCYDQLGDNYLLLGNYELGLNCFREALGVRIRRYGKEDREVAFSHRNMGKAFALMGDNERALEHHQKGLYILVNLLGEDHPLVARAYGDIGLLQTTLGQFQLAAVSTGKALEINLRTYSRVHSEVAGYYGNMGRIFTHSGEYEKAGAHYRERLEITMALYGPDHPWVAKCYSELGELKELENDLSQALKYREKALVIFEKVYAGKHPLIAKELAGIGSVLAGMGRYEEALSSYQKALVASVSEFSEEAVSSHPALEGIASKEILLESLLGKARTLVTFSSGKGGNGGHEEKGTGPDASNTGAPILNSGNGDRENQLRIALKTYQVASSLVDSIRIDFSEKGKRLLARKARPVYQGGTQVAWQLYEEDPDRELLESAWEFFEKGRAVLLLEEIQEEKARRRGSIPDSLLELERTLDARLTDLASRKIGKDGQPVLDSMERVHLRVEEFDLQQRRDSLLDLFRENFPRYYQLKYDLTLAGMTNVHDYLKDDRSLIVEFMVCEDRVYTLGVDKKEAVFHQFPNDSILQNLLRDLLTPLRDPTTVLNGEQNTPEAYRKYLHTAHQLYLTLLEPIFAQLGGAYEELILIPDGALGELPFEILLTEKVDPEKGVSYHELPYLLRAYRTSYAWSATLLLEDHLHPPGQATSQPNHDLLAVAPPYSLWPGSDVSPIEGGIDSLDQLFVSRAESRRGGIPSKLVYAGKEARSLGERYGARVLADSTATERTFAELCATSRILHLGAHGFINPDHPEYSNIALLPSPEDTIRYDGHLYIHEIYDLPLNAELVVLPVCNSGRGEEQAGEGIMSLARAFRQAGCPTVVASQWEVDDETAMNISLNFYQNLSQGYSTAEALRQAKLTQLAEGGTEKAHPYYWAPMILIGEDRLVELEEVSSPGLNWVLIGVLIGAVLLITGLYLRNFKTSKASRSPA